MATIATESQSTKKRALIPLMVIGLTVCLILYARSTRRSFLNKTSTEEEIEAAWESYQQCVGQCPFGCHHDDTDCRVHCEWRCDRKWRPHDLPKADHIPDEF